METTMENTQQKGSALLRAAEITPSVFNPEDIEDQQAYLIFMKTNRWVKRFAVEWPSVTVPATIQRKLMEHFLKPHEKEVEEAIRVLGYNKQESLVN